MLESTDLAREDLRRYSRYVEGGIANPCQAFLAKHPKADPKWAYCNASVVIGEASPFVSQYEGDGRDDIPHDDPRWPVACACGRPFAADDEWQHNRHRLRRTPGGDLVTSRDAPPGAMWTLDWDHAELGPDGHSLYVMLPDGQDWNIDGFAKSGGKWTRRGVPPLIVASPSILTSGYHGFLGGGDGSRPGWLVEC